jgi:sarcosine oxidase subunit beta
VEKIILCHCWDVTTDEIKEIIKGGCSDIEWIKRHTGLGTGSCQGRYCLETTLSWLRESYPQLNWDHLPTARQPLYPIKVWQLAGATQEDEFK